jgi:hypothetical protein
MQTIDYTDYKARKYGFIEQGTYLRIRSSHTDVAIKLLDNNEQVFSFSEGFDLKKNKPLEMISSTLDWSFVVLSGEHYRSAIIEVLTEEQFNELCQKEK